MTILDRCARSPTTVVALGLVAVSLVLVLALPPDTILASNGHLTDMVFQFVSSRAYLADSLRHGHVPLWNPYTYGGEPFLGSFESAVLYPLDLIFLCLPLAPAINFSILLHLVILGWGMERWAASRGLGRWAAALAGFILPLSGAVFPHIYAGHLSNLCTMAWAPWIFLGLETWIRQQDQRGLLLAGAAICLQILAGHIQYFFYTAVAVGIASLIRCANEPAWRRRAFTAVAGCYLAGIALGAAQLFPGLAAAGEGIRQQKLDYEFAAGFSFPPENLLTAIAPGFFGNLGAPAYWGRWSFWEMSLFIGAAGPLLIAIALTVPKPNRARADLVIAGLFLVLALGANTPLFNLLYNFAPGFGHFRSWSKFIFPATLFLTLVMATGADFLLRGGKPSRRIAWAGLLSGWVAVGIGLCFVINPTSVAGCLHLVAGSGESFLPPTTFAQADFIRNAGTHAGLSLGLAGLSLVAGGASFYFQQWLPHLKWVLPALVAIEMIGFASGQITISHLSDAMPDALQQFVAAHPGDYRVLDFPYSNNGFLLGAGDMGGDNPSVLKRYAEFIRFTQGEDPDAGTQSLPFKKVSPLFSLLRFRYAFTPGPDGFRTLENSTPPLPHLLPVSEIKVVAGRDAIFSAMRDTTFDPRQVVMLESEPDPLPESGATATVRLLSNQADELTLEADTDKPTLLLITDLYDSNWRAEAFPDSAQQSYHLMPADYVLRAVPLAKGHHHLRIVYAPAAFPLGVGVSAVAWTLWLGLFIRNWRGWTRAAERKD